MGKIKSLVILGLVLVGVAAPLAVSKVEAYTCSGPGSSLTIEDFGVARDNGDVLYDAVQYPPLNGVGSAGVTNYTNCNLPVSYSTFKQYVREFDFDNQELFDYSATTIVPPGKYLRVEAKTPGCAFQWDLWYGDTPQDFPNNDPRKYWAGQYQWGTPLCEKPPENPPPVGSHDASNCELSYGWACDASDLDYPLSVHLYFDGGPGIGIGYSTTANLPRVDVAPVCGGRPNHGFNFATPERFKDGKDHTVTAYAIDTPGGYNPPLPGTPRTINCPAPALGAMQGFKVKMPGNDPGPNPPAGLKVTLYGPPGSPAFGGISSTANSYGFGDLPAGHYTATVEVPNGWTVGYTSCRNSGTCHGSTPVPGNTVEMDFLAGDNYDVWWHFTAAAPTVTLSANPTSVFIGSTSNLIWSSVNADTCAAAGGPWSGAKAVNGWETSIPLVTTSTFTITCTGPGGSASASATVTVTEVPNPDPIGWHDSSSCSVSTGWTCDASNYNEPLSVHLYADGGPGVGQYMGSVVATLTREKAVADQCGGNANHGWNFVTPASLIDGKDHTISAYAINTPPGYNPALWGTPKAINCPPAPTVDILANLVQGPISLPANGPRGSLRFDWSSTNATACTIAKTGDNQWMTGSVAINQVDYEPWGAAGNTGGTYTITCTGPGGSASDSVTVNIIAPPTLILTAAPPPTPLATINTGIHVAFLDKLLVAIFSNVPRALATGEPLIVDYNTRAVLKWDSEKTDTCWTTDGSPGWESPSVSLDGTWLSDPLTKDFTHTASCSGPGGTVTDFVLIKVRAAPPSVTIHASPAVVPFDSASTLIWNSIGATRCAASGGPWTGDKDLSGSEDTAELRTTTTYQITCWNSEGDSATDSVTVFVSPVKLEVDLKADLGEGYVDSGAGIWPLSDVDLKAVTSGTATGDITYSFWCDARTTNPTVTETISTTDKPHIQEYLDLCDYENEGRYTAKLSVTRSSKTAKDTVEIAVAKACAL